ncbi:hypothetical protein ACIGA4_11885 [Staphylococcus capitis]|uniref:hypothetical protein n=1 Tax=Staphylococcus capitis TaxID=29388 RepID=UPI0037D7FD49
MDRQAFNNIHDELTTHLWQQDYDIERGNINDNKTYIKDIYEYEKKTYVLIDLDQQIETKKDGSIKT